MPTIIASLLLSFISLRGTSHKRRRINFFPHERFQVRRNPQCLHNSIATANKYRKSEKTLHVVKNRKIVQRGVLFFIYLGRRLKSRKFTEEQWIVVLRWLSRFYAHYRRRGTNMRSRSPPRTGFLIFKWPT